MPGCYNLCSKFLTFLVTLSVFCVVGMHLVRSYRFIRYLCVSALAEEGGYQPPRLVGGVLAFSPWACYAVTCLHPAPSIAFMTMIYWCILARWRVFWVKTISLFRSLCPFMYYPPPILQQIIWNHLLCVSKFPALCSFSYRPCVSVWLLTVAVANISLNQSCFLGLWIAMLIYSICQRLLSARLGACLNGCLIPLCYPYHLMIGVLLKLLKFCLCQYCIMLSYHMLCLLTRNICKSLSSVSQSQLQCSLLQCWLRARKQPLSLIGVLLCLHRLWMNHHVYWY